MVIPPTDLLGIGDRGKLKAQANKFPSGEKCEAARNVAHQAAGRLEVEYSSQGD